MKLLGPGGDCAQLLPRGSWWDEIEEDFGGDGAGELFVEVEEYNYGDEWILSFKVCFQLSFMNTLF